MNVGAGPGQNRVRSASLAPQRYKQLFWVWAVFQVGLHDDKQQVCVCVRELEVNEILMEHFAKHN